jgi:hypothetical protein
MKSFSESLDIHSESLDTKPDLIIIYMAWSSPPMLLAASLRLPEKYC